MTSQTVVALAKVPKIFFNCIILHLNLAINNCSNFLFAYISIVLLEQFDVDTHTAIHIHYMLFNYKTANFEADAPRT